MMRGLLILILALFACAPPKPAPPPEAAPMTEVIEEEVSPRRAASLRLVEEGKRDLSSSLFERAAQKFSKAIEVDTGNPYAYFYLGLARFRVGRFQEAAELFARAASLFGALADWKAEALAYRGESLERMGSKEKARVVYEEALRVDPANAKAGEGLARLSGEM